MNDVKITAIKRTGWDRVLDAARITMGKPMSYKEPSDEFKFNMLRSEHSPIRLLEFDILIEDVPNQVVGHLVRHHIGIEKFVATLREDRTGVDPTNATHLTPRTAMPSCNAQALTNISRKRPCNKASYETRKVWQGVVDSIKEFEPLVARFMVPECIYRGFCPEKECCGYVSSKLFSSERLNYTSNECPSKNEN